MSNELMKMLDRTMSVTSLKDLVRMKDNEKVFILVDCSGSMDAMMQNMKRRIDGLREVVQQLRSQGQSFPLVAFGPASHDFQVAYFTETIPEPGGSTPLHVALDLARMHGAGRAIVISDGWPDLQHEALEAAKRLGRVDVIYVGNPGTWDFEDPGSAFLNALAQATGGQRYEGNLAEVKQLTGMIKGLLAGEVLVPVEMDEGDDDLEEEEEEEEEDDDEEDDDEDDVDD